MIGFIESNFKKIYWTLCSLLAVIVAFRCYYIPFAHDEVANFIYYIQPQKIIPFHSHVDAMGHFLNNVGTLICYKLFGSSPFVLRLPNFFSFIILCLGVWKMLSLFKSIYAKLILFSCFLLCYNFIAFFALSRGYGISMAFLVWTFYNFFTYLKTFQFKSLLAFVVTSQLALSANLTLVFILLISTFILIFFQIKEKKFLQFKAILIYVPHFLLIYFWVKYGFYLQENGALYYGSGDSYWKVSFVSLIETLFLKNAILNYLFLATYFGLFIYWLINIFKFKLNYFFSSYFSIAFFLFSSLVLAFFLLKKLLNVNYPEDRTGLFFYITFVLSLAFFIEESKPKFSKFIIAVPLVLIAAFGFQLDIKNHPWAIYETVPKRFIDKLIQEQKNSSEKITIAGYRLREFIYGFINYSNSEKLNHITSPEALQMNCDYAIAYKHEEPYYNLFYEEIDSESKWNFVLLKRKEKLQQELIYESVEEKNWNGEWEYFNAFEKLDITFNSINPLKAQFNFNFQNVPAPLNAWLVVEVQSSEAESENIFVRVPLNLIQKNWNEKNNQIIDVITGNIPKKIKRIVCYLWNIDKQTIQIKLNSFKLFRLKGKGVTLISQAKL